MSRSPLFSSGRIIHLNWLTDAQDRLLQYLPDDDLSEQLAPPEDAPAWHAWISPYDRRRVLNARQTAQAQQLPYRLCYRLEPGNGSSTLTVIEAGSPRLGDDGRFAGYAGSLISLPDSGVEAPTETHANEQRFHRLTRLSSDWFWETDAQHRFTYLSDGVKRVLGIDPEELLGRTRWELAADPDSPELLACRRKVAQQRPFRGIRYEIRLPGMCVGRQAEIAGEPVFENGQFIGYQGVAHDVTADVAYARELAALVGENQAFLDNALDIIALMDYGGRIRKINHACRALTGYTEEELLLKPFQKFVLQTSETVDGAPAFGRSDDVADTTGNTESTWLHKSGRHVRISWSWRRTADGMFYVTGRDITERYHSRLALRRLNQRLNMVLESIGDAFVSVDEQWCVSYANHKMAALCDLEHGEMQGRPLWDLLPAHWRDQLFGHFQQELKHGEHAFFEHHFAQLGTWLEVRAYCHDEGLSIFVHDVTERRRAELAARDREQRLREVIEATPGGYFECDGQGRLRHANPALSELSAYSETELRGRNITLILPECPAERFFRPDGQSAVHGLETLLIRRGGDIRYISINANAKRDEHGRPEEIVGFITDITARKQNERQLEKLATHDPVTGLRNRTFINLHLQTVLDTAARDECNAVMFIDLDRFKEVNDELGHEAGDALLKEIARRLREATRPGDIVARFGGDEFVIVAHCGRAFERAATRIAEKLCNVIAEPVALGEETVQVGASIGISLTPRDGTTTDELFKKADFAMYRVKDSGRNGWHLFDPEHDEVDEPD